MRLHVLNTATSWRLSRPASPSTDFATSLGAIVNRSKTDSGPLRWLTPMTTMDMAVSA
jgi:hypothetical protein